MLCCWSGVASTVPRLHPASYSTSSIYQHATPLCALTRSRTEVALSRARCLSPPIRRSPRVVCALPPYDCGQRQSLALSHRPAQIFRADKALHNHDGLWPRKTPQPGFYSNANGGNKIHVYAHSERLATLHKAVACCTHIVLCLLVGACLEQHTHRCSRARSSGAHQRSSPILRTHKPEKFNACSALCTGKQRWVLHTLSRLSTGTPPLKHFAMTSKSPAAAASRSRLGVTSDATRGFRAAGAGECNRRRGCCCADAGAAVEAGAGVPTMLRQPWFEHSRRIGGSAAGGEAHNARSRGTWLAYRFRRVQYHRVPPRRPRKRGHHKPGCRPHAVARVRT